MNKGEQLVTTGVSDLKGAQSDQAGHQRLSIPQKEQLLTCSYYKKNVYKLKNTFKMGELSGRVS